MIPYSVALGAPQPTPLQRLLGIIRSDVASIIAVHPNYCWQDAARTTPAGVGDPVWICDDRSGQGLHLTAMASSQRGTLSQDANGFYYIARVDDTTGYYTASGDGATGQTLAGVASLSGFDGVVRGIVSNRGIDSTQGNPLRPTGLWIQGNAGNDGINSGCGDGSAFNTTGTTQSVTANTVTVFSASAGDGNRTNSIENTTNTTTQTYARPSTPAPGTAQNPTWVRVFLPGSPTVTSADMNFYGCVSIAAFRAAGERAAIRYSLAQLTIGRSILA